MSAMKSTGASGKRMINSCWVLGIVAYSIGDIIVGPNPQIRFLMESLVAHTWYLEFSFLKGGKISSLLRLNWHSIRSVTRFFRFHEH